MFFNPPGSLGLPGNIKWGVYTPGVKHVRTPGVGDKHHLSTMGECRKCP